eukprot:CAMPEP_0195286154 /NCGR_PEP_ID=MMETSP0707-20130614/3715_1 /TAXON_ID=33640 /ORGANISM="Asterionellopsis glacialis, Strain CCMP134" /LENGTH=358 /DNA_ID=CAMNT_0040345753 /DNA_START=359 /DNA_END=1435 /DNA_ORIENTATION=-
MPGYNNNRHLLSVFSVLQVLAILIVSQKNVFLVHGLQSADTIKSRRIPTTQKQQRRPRRPRPTIYETKEVPKPLQSSPLSTDSSSTSSSSATTTIHTSTSTTTDIDKWLNLQFWRKPRTKYEIEHHVLEALDSIPFHDGTNPTVHVLQHEPVLLVIDDFISEDMCQSIMKAASSTTLQRSTMGMKEVQSTDRTSSTSWLHEAQCEVPLRLVAEKVARVSGLPPTHMENLQVVRYQPGQEFTIHTDHSNYFNDMECRGRLATCLIYLQEPTGGGETRFFEFKQNVRPRKGSAVFFWNTYEKPGCTGYDPQMCLTVDLRLRHAGLPVVEGEKWVCNSWIHPIEFQAANVRGVPQQKSQLE